jgi:hypothetical protein
MTDVTAEQPALSPLEHQGRKLPDTLDGTLQPVFKLKEKSEFIKWGYRVYAYLELLDLEDLVSDLPRPNRNAPSYTKWRKHSKMVRTWLISAMHNDLLDDIIYCGERLEYADEFLRRSLLDHIQGTISTRYGIQTMVRSYDQAMLISMKTVMKIKTNLSRDQQLLAHVVLHPIQMVEMMRSSHLDTMYD